MFAVAAAGPAANEVIVVVVDQEVEVGFSVPATSASARCPL
jgi:hypothetical protein